MIRPAIISDLPRLLELVLAMHKASEYPARGVEVWEPAAKSLLRDAVIRNGRTNDGGTLLNVVERGGKVEGFMLSIIQRVYVIGKQLEAQDFWLYCSPKAPKIATSRFVDAYIEWAFSNPKVVDLTLSCTDVAGVDVKKLTRIYEAKGATKRGEIWKMRNGHRLSFRPVRFSSSL